MLVTFTTDASADITMFGDVAFAMLRMMGHSPTVPGAILVDDLSAALARLRAGVAATSAHDQVSQQNDVRTEDDERPVSLGHRALPLIQLLEAALADKENVMWD